MKNLSIKIVKSFTQGLQIKNVTGFTQEKTFPSKNKFRKIFHI